MFPIIKSYISTIFGLCDFIYLFSLPQRRALCWPGLVDVFQAVVTRVVTWDREVTRDTLNNKTCLFVSEEEMVIFTANKPKPTDEITQSQTSSQPAISGRRRPCWVLQKTCRSKSKIKTWIKTEHWSTAWVLRSDLSWEEMYSVLSAADTRSLSD